MHTDGSCLPISEEEIKAEARCPGPLFRKNGRPTRMRHAAPSRSPAGAARATPPLVAADDHPCLGAAGRAGPHAFLASLLVVVGGDDGLGVRRPLGTCGLVLPGGVGGIARGGLARAPGCTSQGWLTVLSPARYDARGLRGLRYPGIGWDTWQAARHGLPLAVDSDRSLPALPGLARPEEAGASPHPLDGD